MDRIGRGSGRNTATASIIVDVVDANDHAPRFMKKKYQGFMNADLSALRNDLQVQAVDADEPRSKNSAVRYEILTGNYERKFSIDERTGVITVREPLVDAVKAESRRRRRGHARTRNGRQSAESDGDNSIVDPVITLTVRAYDLGIPSLDAEVPVHIYTDDVFTRTMRFIIPESPELVDRQQEAIR